MAESIRIVGVHAIPANEPCYLLEIELKEPSDNFDFGSVTQEIPGQLPENWQVAWDEQQIGGNESSSRWTFFFHDLNFERPILTPFGPLKLPALTPIPAHLKVIEYHEP